MQIIMCNIIKINSKNNKYYKIFDIGFKNETLCYLHNLKHLIFKYFEIKEFD